MSSSRYRKSCAECQVRHLKCDLTKPCKPCSEEGRNCLTPSRYQFRHDFNPSVSSRRKKAPSSRFKPGQPWTKVPKQIRFAEQQPQDVDEDVLFDGPAEHSDATEVETTTDNITNTSPSDLTEPHFSLPTQNLSSEQEEHILTPTFPTESLARRTYSLDRPKPLWPLPRKDEAFLLQHFTTELATWFDYCDRHKHFSTIVIPAAATSPILLNAILAVSAGHLSITQNFDRYAPDRYQHECLKTLIPALANPEALLDDNLFAATVILRLFHEMTQPIDEPSPSQHILGSHMIVEARERARTQTGNTSTTSSLRFATLNIELRQEVHIAFMTNRPPPPSLVEYCDIDRSFEPTDDWMWTYRIIAQTADTLTYCNGDGPKTLGRWEKLWNYLDKWESLAPPSFRPMFEEVADSENGKLFPEMWFANDCHAAGHHYLAMSRILVLAHDPRVPRLGPDRTMALKERDGQIKDLLLKICGIACSNRHFPLITFSAGVAIAMCGERFTERAEQEALIDILADAEAHVVWPCLRARERLKKCWGWDDASDSF